VPPSYRFCPLCATALAVLPDGPDAGRPACPRGHFVFYDNPAVTAYAFVRDSEDRYLVLQRAVEPYRGNWDLPGGFVEPGETPADAIRRELAEETGLAIAIERMLGAFSSQYGDSGRWTVDIGFEARVVGGVFRLDEAEKLSYEWLPLSEVPRLSFKGERSGLAVLRGQAVPT
jgi:8-oxo-dGTP diphosphatase